MNSLLLLLSLIAALLMLGVMIASAITINASDMAETPWPTILVAMLVFTGAGLLVVALPFAVYQVHDEVQDRGSHALLVLLTAFDCVVGVSLWVWRQTYRSQLLDRHLRPQARYRRRRDDGHRDDGLVTARMSED